MSPALGHDSQAVHAMTLGCARGLYSFSCALNAQMAFASTLSRFSRFLMAETSASLASKAVPTPARPLYCSCKKRTYSARPTAVDDKRKPVTVRGIRRKHRNAERISMVTAYDYNQAVLTERFAFSSCPFFMALTSGSSAVDMILVGDSVGMVALGHETTVPVTVDDVRASHPLAKSSSDLW